MRLVLLAFSVSLFAQQPRITNARLETRPLSGSLENEIDRLKAASAGPEWVGYAVPTIPGNHVNCWSDSGRGTTVGPVRLEGPTEMMIVFRLADHALDKVKVYSIDCELDAGGLPFTWLTSVSAGASVSYLAKIAAEHKNQAITAIAMHSGAEADGALEQLTSLNQPEKVREAVPFWLGSTRGQHGIALLKQMLERDPSERVRDKIMFALSVSKDPSASSLLIASARNDRSPRVRGQALFWLAHKAGQKETEAITRAILDDPELKVKKQAVFALKQLPPDEGIPLLIQVARTSSNPEVRKQAMFWLGQSQDERAVKFFEDVLKK